jgi:hypothetical protein
MYITTYVSTLSGNANMALSLIQGTGVDLGIRSNPNTLWCKTFIPVDREGDMGDAVMTAVFQQQNK